MKKSILPLFVLILAFITTATVSKAGDNDKKYKKTEVTKDQLPQQVQNVLSADYSNWQVVTAYKMVPANNDSKENPAKATTTTEKDGTKSPKDAKKPRATKSDVTDTEMQDDNTERNAKAGANPDEQGVHYEVVLTDGTATKNVKIKTNGEVIE